MIRVRIGDEQARVYSEGGIGFDHHVKGIGWVLNDRPDRLVARLALAVRREAFPHLADIGTDDIIEWTCPTCGNVAKFDHRGCEV